MAAYTVSNPVHTVFGNQKVIFCRLSGDGTAYVSGGDPVLPAWFGMKRVEYIVFQSLDSSGVNLPIFLRGDAGATPKIYQIILSSALQYSGSNTLVYDAIVIGQ